ncbi:oocyte zinc finger protein XlCOF20-like [Odontomachus brunneus]|uniref:oocyte zinc finger protein XlCOF20-like n=1 Tax=Odontomachus brunneus TaxID=486640 RepID=UPI0013F1B9C5|nr:oocyte zinc finger protein XlCOF20-like [Odontomachus brunneus]
MVLTANDEASIDTRISLLANINIEMVNLKALYKLFKTEDSATVLQRLTQERMFCDKLPRDVWRLCKDSLRCIKCEKRYSDWRSLRKHMNYFCLMDPLFPCPYCSHKARLTTLLKYHILREHMCQAPANKKRQLVHTDLVSPRHGVVTKSEDLLAEHSGKPLFVCPKCGKGYSWKASLQRHLSTVCGTPPMLFCNLCGYKSSRKDVLFRHMRHVHPRS